MVKGSGKVKKRKFPMSPARGDRVRRALHEIKEKQVTIRKACNKYDLSYGYLHRRLSGDVDKASRNGPSPIFSVK